MCFPTVHLPIQKPRWAELQVPDSAWQHQTVLAVSIPYHCALSVGKKKTVSLNNFLGEVVKSIAFIKSQSLSPCLALLCDEMGGPHKALPLHVKVQWYLQESTCVMVGNGQWWALSHVKHLFT